MPSDEAWNRQSTDSDSQGGWMVGDERMMTDKELLQKARGRKLGPMRFVRWTQETVRYILKPGFTKHWHFDFYGVGIGGYYIGFLNGHLRK